MSPTAVSLKGNLYSTPAHLTCLGFLFFTLLTRCIPLEAPSDSIWCFPDPLPWLALDTHFCSPGPLRLMEVLCSSSVFQPVFSEQKEPQGGEKQCKTLNFPHWTSFSLGSCPFESSCLEDFLCLYTNIACTSPAFLVVAHGWKN